MGSSTAKIDLEQIDEQKIIVFYEWLQGKDSPEGCKFENKLNLTADEAFTVLWYLQEVLEILPDKYEQCKECKCLYDSYYEGETIIKDTCEDESLHGFYCDCCRPYYIEED